MSISGDNDLVKGIVERVLAAEVDQRDAVLEDECHGDPQLIERVRLLLVGELEATNLINENDLSGKVIGPYKLRKIIGEGGFAEVFLAEQNEPVRRTVALKVLKPGMDSREILTRFEIERQALALMQHSGIAKIYDAGITDNGRSWFAMEYVDGVAITKYCDTNKLRLDERLELFIDVCDAVQHAHQKGIIHRDVKPSNVLVSVSEGRPCVKVIDFGIAKSSGARITENTLFTAHGAILGTPSYMSPEQAEMEGGNVDTRTDIYSLGVLLYELMVGEPPFHSQRLLEAGYGEVLRIIREEVPPRLSLKATSIIDSEQTANARCLRQESLTKRLAGDLDWITLKALEKDRTRRYSTVQEFGLDIRRHLSHQPVAAGPPSPLYIFKKFVSRNRLGVTAAILVVSATLGAGVFSFFQWKKAVEAKGEAEDATELALAEKEKAVKAKSEADDAAELALAEKAKADKAKSEAEDATKLALAERAKAEEAFRSEEAQRKYAQLQTSRLLDVEEWYGESLDDLDLEFAGDYLKTLFNAALGADGREGKPDKEIDYVGISRSLIAQALIVPMVESVKSRFPDDALVQHNLLQELSHITLELGMVQEHHQACLYCYEVSQNENVDTKYIAARQKMMAAGYLGESFRQLGDNKSAQKYLQECLKEFEKLESDDYLIHVDDIEDTKNLHAIFKGKFLADLASVEASLFNYEIARSLLKESSALGYEESNYRLGWLEYRLGNYREAISVAQRDLEADIKAFQFEFEWERFDFENGQMLTRSLLSEAYRELGEHDKALALTKEVVEWRLQNLGGSHLNTIQSTESIAAIYLRQKEQLPEAEKILRECMSKYEEISASSETIVFCHNRLIEALYLQGKEDEARKERDILLKKLAELDLEKFGDVVAEVIVSLVEDDFEDTNLAVDLLERAVESAESYDLDKAVLVSALQWLGVAKLDVRDYPKGRFYLEKVYTLVKEIEPKGSHAADSAYFLGEYWRAQNNVENAKRYYLEAIEIYRGFDESIGKAYYLNQVLISIGCMLKSSGYEKESRVYLIELISLTEEYPDYLEKRHPKLFASMKKAATVEEKLDLFDIPFGIFRPFDAADDPNRDPFEFSPDESTDEDPDRDPFEISE